MELVNQEAIETFCGAKFCLRQALVIGHADLACRQTIKPRGEHIAQELDGIVGALGQFFEGEATSEIGLKAGLWRDVWTAVSPDTGALRPVIDAADADFVKVTKPLTPEQRSAVLGQTLNGFVQRYRDDPPPATFRLITSPLIQWMWIGALIAIGGGLIALWPAPDAARRRATAKAAARVAQDLGRA